ncbi:ComF family protein [Microbacterium pseudoresistens]|uniref:Putative amidophosphoribosyltransferase n=1 Tax=Microbacterium pseudoresistens TaxID=640634 RepID=A0A7Y9EW26_9MICO|nr:phosphoribosyltransferase family protein [Microbacterium pseudoresistens]NYD54987.1 putative amidophosphoribosyltransferase [Microbacterium pseudoresistens]
MPNNQTVPHARAPSRASALRGLLGPLRDALREALEAATGAECAGCGAVGQGLCGACRSALAPRVHRVTTPAGRAVHAGAPFAGAMARAVRAVKEEGRTALIRDLGPAMADAVAAALAAGDGRGIRVPVALVPVPTSRAAFRRRGFRVPDLLCRRIGAVEPVLVAARRIADQRGLDRRARVRNVAGSMRARRPGAGRAVIVVDDVVTTGATMDEAVRALEAQGWCVIGCAATAATPRSHDASRR